MKTKLNEYVKVAEAAEMLGVSQGTLRNWAEAGKIPVHTNPVNGYSNLSIAKRTNTKSKASLFSLATFIKRARTDADIS